MSAAGVYPVRVDASLDAPLSRWLWIVKWVLVIPHYIVLAFMWAAFVVLSVVAWVAILATGRYPRAIFDFNVGVLRWTWRVQYYAFSADRCPPFMLADDPSYPAHLEVEYPQRLCRGLALVKWRLRAIPKYIIVGLFTGSGLWFTWRAGYQDDGWGGLGLIGILTVIAAAVLLVTGRYPEQIFDFMLGMNRWVLRVAAYGGLMTDQYPPFRLDMGGHDPGTLILPPPARQSPPEGAFLEQAGVGGQLTSSGGPDLGAGTAWPAGLGGMDGRPDRLGSRGSGRDRPRHGGSPGALGIWTARAAGRGTQTLIWPVKSGDWMAVAMNADGSALVRMQVNVAAMVVALPWVAAGLLIGGFIFLGADIALIMVPVRRMS